jgi:hypothetical protein
MAYQWRLNPVFFIIESFAAVRLAFGMVDTGSQRQGDTLPADVTASRPTNCLEAGCAEPAALLAPYQGVARRKPMSGSAPFCYPASVLRPKA